MSCSSVTKSITHFIAYIGLPIVIALFLIAISFNAFGPRTLTEVNIWLAVIGTWLLAFILFVKPLSLLAAKCKLLRPITCSNLIAEWKTIRFEFQSIISLVISTVAAFCRFCITLRRPLGVATFYLLFGHSIIAGFQFLSRGNGLIDMITNLSLALGILGLIALFVGWITSNNISMKILKRNWKILQYTAYLGYILGAIHAYMFEEKIYLATFVLWVILKILEWTIGKRSI
jgi:DMSO/TMAO reductase YedYZ heme-binding membrane subunit